MASTLKGVLTIVDPDTGQAVKMFEADAPDLHSVAYLGPRPRPRTLSRLGEAEAERGEAKAGHLLCQSVFDTRQVDGDWRRVKAIREERKAIEKQAKQSEKKKDYTSAIANYVRNRELTNTLFEVGVFGEENNLRKLDKKISDLKNKLR